MVLWGVVTIGEGLVRTFGGLVAMRVLLGLFEAGLFPYVDPKLICDLLLILLTSGCVYLISMVRMVEVWILILQVRA